jgi:D-arabinose 1-dehydrogenase-like Zn-dependent alcohol dehydrogenase
VKAAVQKGFRVAKVEDVPELSIRPDQTKVKIEYAGVCSTDIEILEGAKAMKALIRP